MYGLFPNIYNTILYFSAGGETWVGDLPIVNGINGRIGHGSIWCNKHTHIYIYIRPILTKIPLRRCVVPIHRHECLLTLFYIRGTFVGNLWPIGDNDQDLKRENAGFVKTSTKSVFFRKNNGTRISATPETIQNRNKLNENKKIMLEKKISKIFLYVCILSFYYEYVNCDLVLNNFSIFFFITIKHILIMF